MAEPASLAGSFGSGSTDQRQSLGVALRPLWTRRWALLLLVIAATAGTYFLFDSRPKEYTASTRLLVGADQVQQVIQATSSFLGPREVQNQADILGSDPVAQRAAQSLGVESASVDVTTEASADIIVVSSTQNDPRYSARVANAFVDAYVSASSARSRDLLDDAIDTVQQQLDSLPRTRGNAGQRTVLGDRLRQLQILQSQPPVAARQIESATPPTEPSAPKPTRNAIFAFALSLLVGIFAAFGLDRFDRRLRSVEDMESAFGQPVLGALVHVSDAATLHEGAATLPENLVEQLRTLRTNLQLSALDQPHRRLLVTSAVPGEGKSTLVRNLAIVQAEFGLTVAVIEADLRRPSLSRAFGIEAEHGLTNVLAGDVSLEQAAISVPLELRGLDVAVLEQRANGNGQAGEDRRPGSVTFLAAGAHPPNAPALLASQRMRDLLNTVAETHDLVLIDTPPLLAVADALPLVSDSDATLIVARLNVTTRDSVQRLSTTVARVPGFNLAGVVVNDLAGLERRQGYNYYPNYSAKQNKRSRRGRRSREPELAASEPTG